MAYELWTFQDAIDHLIDLKGPDRTLVTLRKAKRAIVEAYRDLASYRRWTYYQQRARITTVASYTTGTVQYTNSTRTLAISGGTWPSWITSGIVQINQIPYQVDSVDPNTAANIILSPTSNPGADLAAGTSFVAYQESYPLPDDFQSVGATINATNLYIPVPGQVSDLIETTRLSGGPTIPRMYAFTSDPHVTDGLVIRFAPPPNQVINYEVYYQRRGRRLGVDNYSTGTLTTTAGSTSVTGSGTAFTSLHAGCVVRFSADSANLPTSIYGSSDSTINTNPAVFQGIIQSVTSGTAFKLQSAAPTSLSGVKFTVSDPIEVEVGAMFTAFLRKAELAFARFCNDSLSAPMAAAHDALMDAAAADDRSSTTEQHAGWRRYPPFVDFSLPQVIP